MSHDVVEIDAATGEVTVRPFTVEESAQRAADVAAEAEAKAAADTIKADRTAARDSAIARFRKLGFTDAEIATLVLP